MGILELLHEVVILFSCMLIIVLSIINSLNQEAFESSPSHDTQSPEVTSKAMESAEDVSGASSKKDVNDSIQSLTEKLSAALVNVIAKEDLVKQHAKVAEEAVAGSTPTYNARERLLFRILRTTNHNAMFRCSTLVEIDFLS